jgi:hypothetical protein
MHITITICCRGLIEQLNIFAKVSQLCLVAESLMVQPITVAKANMHIINKNSSFGEFCFASFKTAAISPLVSKTEYAALHKHITMLKAFLSEVNAPFSSCDLIRG